MERSEDVGLDGAMFRITCIGDAEGSCDVVNAEEWPADTMTEQRRAAMEAASAGVPMNNIVVFTDFICFKSGRIGADGRRPDVQSTKAFS